MDHDPDMDIQSDNGGANNDDHDANAASSSSATNPPGVRPSDLQDKGGHTLNRHVEEFGHVFAEHVDPGVTIRNGTGSNFLAANFGYFMNS